MADGANFGDKSLAELGGTAEGDQAKGVVDSMFTADITDSEKVERFGNGAQQLKTWAEGGSFAINEEGMRAYLKAIDLFMDGYKEQTRALQRLTTPMKLGAHPYAKMLSPFLASVWDGDERSLLPNLKKMKTAFEDAREALVAARKNYDESDESASISFKSANLDG